MTVKARPSAPRAKTRAAQPQGNTKGNPPGPPVVPIPKVPADLYPKPHPPLQRALLIHYAITEGRSRADAVAMADAVLGTARRRPTEKRPRQRRKTN